MSARSFKTSSCNAMSCVGRVKREMYLQMLDQYNFQSEHVLLEDVSDVRSDKAET